MRAGAVAPPALVQENRRDENAFSESMSEISYGLAAWGRPRRLSSTRVVAAYTIASLVSVRTS